MKRILFFGSLLIALATLYSFQTSSISETTEFDKAIKEAKKSNKMVFMDAYTSWCGWCKKLDQTTFADSSVKAYLDKHFVILKMDMESDEGRLLGREYRVSGYPTLLFINTKEEVISRIDGYVGTDIFLEEAKKARGK